MVYRDVLGLADPMDSHGLCVTCGIEDVEYLARLAVHLLLLLP